MNKIAAIILAAGKGKRINSKDTNKVTLLLGNKPMILHTIDLLKSLDINNIVVVVGFAKKSVMDVLGAKVNYIEQKRQLGTADAVLYALDKIKSAKDVIVLNGDDSAFYTKETMARLIKVHRKKSASLTFLTIELDNPEGLGRVIRDQNNKIIRIVEEKDASMEIKKIEEINPGCYIFDIGFLRKYIKKIRESRVTGEYYLTRVIDIAIKNNEKVETIRGGKIPWRGINTMEELKEAERMFLQEK